MHNGDALPEHDAPHQGRQAQDPRQGGASKQRQPGRVVHLQAGSHVPHACPVPVCAGKDHHLVAGSSKSGDNSAATHGHSQGECQCMELGA